MEPSPKRQKTQIWRPYLEPAMEKRSEVPQPPLAIAWPMPFLLPMSLPLPQPLDLWMMNKEKLSPPCRVSGCIQCEHVVPRTPPQPGCVCPVCGKVFSRHWLLQGHLRTHTGEKPFKCPKCSKAFADKSNMRAHLQTHSGLKPWACNRCGKHFALKSYLSKHQESACVQRI